MANNTLILQNSTKRVVVKCMGNANEGNALKIDAGSLFSALNANNQLLNFGGTLLTDRKPFYGLFLNRVMYDVTGGDTNGMVTVRTDGTQTPNSIITLSRSGDLRFDEGGYGMHIDVLACGNTAASTTGNVYFDVVGFQGANASYSIILDFRKEPRQYDPGKYQDPTAFNYSTGNNGNRGPS